MMKAIARLVIMAVAMAFAIQADANTGNERAISVDKLPAAALQTIHTHFPGRKIALAKMEKEFFSKNYSVIFTNGEKVEFDGSGRWTEIKCKRSAVPATLVPAKIAQYIKVNYPSCRILEIEREDGEIEVTLSNHVEVTFNGRYEVIDIE